MCIRPAFHCSPIIIAHQYAVCRCVALAQQRVDLILIRANSRAHLFRAICTFKVRARCARCSVSFAKITARTPLPSNHYAYGVFLFTKLTHKHNNINIMLWLKTWASLEFARHNVFVCVCVCDSVTEWCQKRYGISLYFNYRTRTNVKHTHTHNGLETRRGELISWNHVYKYYIP